MWEWEYAHICLNSQPFKPIEVLNHAGKDGWELVVITSNNIA
jgi:hypothetical protein